MQPLLYFFVPFVLAAARGSAAKIKPGSSDVSTPSIDKIEAFRNTIGIKVELSTWGKNKLGRRVFQRNNSKGKVLIPFGIPRKRICPLTYLDDVWQCQKLDNVTGDPCKARGLAVVVGKENEIATITSYRMTWTRPKKNLVLTICPGQDVEMTKRPFKPTYFWSTKSTYPAVLVIESAETVTANPDWIAEYMSATVTGKLPVIEKQWGDAQKKIINEGVRVVNIPTRSTKADCRKANDVADDEWKVPVKLKSDTVSYFFVDFDKTGGADGKSHFKHPRLQILESKDTVLLSRDHIGLKCPVNPADPASPTLVEFEVFGPWKYAEGTTTYLMAGEGVVARSALVESRHKFTFSHREPAADVLFNKVYTTFPREPAKAYCSMPFPDV